MPLWLFTVGQKILTDTVDAHITIPYRNIFASLVSVLIPVIIGLLVKHKKPSVADFLVKLVRPLFVIMILFMIIVGFYVNWYLIRLFTVPIIIAAALLPYLGFIISGIIALVLRQPKPRVIAISIETGIQNTGIPIMLTLFSLPQPEAALSLVSPIAVALCLPVPLWTAVGILEIRKRYWKKKQSKDNLILNDKSAVPNGHGTKTECEDAFTLLTSQDKDSMTKSNDIHAA